MPVYSSGSRRPGRPSRAFRLAYFDARPRAGIQAVYGEPIAAARRASVPDSVPLLKLRWTYASVCAKDPGASLEMLIETTPLLEECVLTARRLLGDEHEVTVIGNRVLLEHVENVAKAKARRVLERFISRFKARHRARSRAT